MERIQKMRRSLSSKKGFTLVELIVVIVIIAILAAALVTSLVGYINKARDTNALVEANNVYTAAQAYTSEKNVSVTGEGDNTWAKYDKAALIEQINTYLGSGVVKGGTDATAKGEITGFVTNDKSTIVTFQYTATNGSKVSYTQAGGWENVR